MSGVAWKVHEAAALGGRGRARVIAFDRLRGGDRRAARVVELVAKVRHVPVRMLLQRSRCAAEVASARQLAMYLMHVVLRVTTPRSAPISTATAPPCRTPARRSRIAATIRPSMPRLLGSRPRLR